MKRVIGTFDCPVSVYIENEQYQSALRSINKLVTGKEHANKLDKSGKLIPINTPEIDAKLGEIHYRLKVTRCITVEFDVDETGEFVNYRIKNKK